MSVNEYDLRTIDSQLEALGSTYAERAAIKTALTGADISAVEALEQALTPSRKFHQLAKWISLKVSDKFTDSKSEMSDRLGELLKKKKKEEGKKAIASQLKELESDMGEIVSSGIYEVFLDEV